MHLLTFSTDDRTTLGLELSGYIIDIGVAFAVMEAQSPSGLPAPPLDMRSFLEAGDPAIRAAHQVRDYMLDNIAHGRMVGLSGRPRSLFRRDEVTILAPITNPHKILLLGLNYREHADETHMQLPTAPTIFAKYDNAIIGPGQPIVLPKVAPNQVDLEAELAVVIGRPARHVPLDEALSYVAGYTLLNDVSARDLQKAVSQWVIGKSPDTFAPMGPYLVTADEIPDPQNLAIRSWRNDFQMQDSNTRQMIFTVAYLVHYISQVMTLQPGDIISTGTPSGVGVARRPPMFLEAGDVVRIEIEGIGTLENPVVAEQ